MHGLIRRASTFNTTRIDHLYKDPHDPEARLFLHYGDLSDSEQTGNVIYNMKPDEIYHLGAQTHVRVSFDMPEYTGNIGALGTVRILESIRRSNHGAKYYQASSSEMFGAAPPPQNEDTPLNPLSPYAAAKVYAYHITNNYRDAYGIFASNGILFNHESPRRGETFVTRKVTRAVAAIVARKEKYLYLGNLDAKRDWGFAPEYVECMWRILQSEKPENYVVGTGQAHSVREFVETAFSYVGLNSEDYTRTDKRYVRPLDPSILMADSSKASRRLGWKPKVAFQDLVKIMVDAEMRRIGLPPVGEGDKILGKTFPERWWTVD